MSENNRQRAERLGIGWGGLAEPDPTSPFGLWLHALALYIGAPSDHPDDVAGHVAQRFGEPFPPEPVGEFCPHCGHPWRAHNHGGPDGCDAWTNPQAPSSYRNRCGCLAVLAPSPVGLRPIPPRPTAADNPGDSTLAVVQALWDLLAPLRERVASEPADVDTVHLARVMRGNGAESIIGTATSREGALACLGAFYLRASEDGRNIVADRPEIVALRLDDPQGKVV